MTKGLYRVSGLLPFSVLSVPIVHLHVRQSTLQSLFFIVSVVVWLLWWGKGRKHRNTLWVNKLKHAEWRRGDKHKWACRWVSQKSKKKNMCSIVRSQTGPFWGVMHDKWLINRQKRIKYEDVVSQNKHAALNQFTLRTSCVGDVALIYLF